MKIQKTHLPDISLRPHLSTVYAAYIIDKKYRTFLAKTGQYTHLRIRRIDNQPIIEYPIFQRIKNALLGENIVAIQVFPKNQDYIDNSNTYHLFTWEGIKVPNLVEMYKYTILN